MENEINRRRDSLTGLLNIQEFRDRSREVILNEPDKDRVNAFLFIDLVDFKAFNEKRGFEAGDNVLREFSQILKNAFMGRLVGRFSGDHFAVLTFSDEVDPSLARVREDMGRNPVLSLIHFRVGICLLHDRTMDSIIACDRAKIAADSLRGTGDTGVQYFDDELDAMIRRRRYIIDNIDRAIANGYIKVYYQPVIRSITGELAGMEALARWDDPEYGLLPPAVFVETLEEKHLIYKLDLCILRQVCRDLREWEDKGVSVIPISFNLSRLDFELCDTLSEIEKTVSEFQIQKSLLHIEITESVLNSDERFMKEIIDKFHKAGYQVWMDDFGSGYSSLNVMKDYDFDLLKIDMKFLSDFSDRSKLIIKSIVSMAKKLGIHTLAEGVETREHAAFLRDIGCEKQQGYYYSKPVPCDLEKLKEYGREFRIEKPLFRKYYDEIGLVSMSDLTQEDLKVPREASPHYGSSLATFLFERVGEDCRMISCSRAFEDQMKAFGVPSIEELEKRANDQTGPFGRQIHTELSRMDDPEGEEDYFQVDVNVNQVYGILSVRKISQVSGRTAYVGILTNLSGDETYRQIQNLNSSMSHFYTVFDRIDQMNPAANTGECIFSKSSYSEVEKKGKVDLREGIRLFADQDVFPADRDRYLAFLDPDTMENRILNSPKRYLTGLFRIRESEGTYTWVEFLLFSRNTWDHSVLHTMRRVNPGEEEILYHYFEEDEDEEQTIEDPDKTGGEDRIHRNELWDTLIEDRRMGIFWKDASRRFAGANRTFMKYYGFSNPRDFIGKTDEDMGWHVNPDAFKKTEEDVLTHGRVTEDMPGKCLVNGQNRDIAATKRPIYRNGRIVGLLGYFTDVTEEEERRDLRIKRTFIDQLTGALNPSGLQKSLPSFIDQYMAHGKDFAMYSIDIQSFHHFNELYGVEFGDAVLRLVAEKLKKEIGITGLVSRVGADHFLLVRQFDGMEEVERLSRDFQAAVGDIHDVNGIPTTVYIHVGAAVYSEDLSLDRMKENANKRMEEGK